MIKVSFYLLLIIILFIIFYITLSWICTIALFITIISYVIVKAKNYIKRIMKHNKRSLNIFNFVLFIVLLSCHDSYKEKEIYWMHKKWDKQINEEQLLQRQLEYKRGLREATTLILISVKNDTNYFKDLVDWDIFTHNIIYKIDSLSKNSINYY